MSRRHISQREAHELAKRVELMEIQLQQQRRAWARDYVGGTSLGHIKRERDWIAGRLEAAHRLEHAVVATVDDAGTITFYALPLPK